MPEKHPLTEALIAAHPLPTTGRAVLLDARTPGLQLRLYPTGRRTWSWFRRIQGGGPERATFGRWPTMGVEEARRHAAQLNGLVAEGESPREQRQAIDHEMTFAELFAIYLEKWARVRKRSWRGDESKYRRHLLPLHPKKLSTITRQEVAAIHSEIGLARPAFANRVLALLSKVFNFGRESGLIEMDNPTRGVRHYRETSRDRFLSGEELQRLHAALQSERSRVCGYFMLCLLTGARKRDLLAMRWGDLDLSRNVWRIPTSKNGLPLTIPLVPQALEILTSLRQAQDQGAAWVFPSSRSATGHWQDPASAWKRLLAHARIADAHIHDLRRTLGSWQAITGASLPIIGKSLGHQSQRTTAIYARLDLDPVRSSMERATDKMMSWMV